MNIPLEKKAGERIVDLTSQEVKNLFSIGLRLRLALQVLHWVLGKILKISKKSRRYERAKKVIYRLEEIDKRPLQTKKFTKNAIHKILMKLH